MNKLIALYKKHSRTARLLPALWLFAATATAKPIADTFALYVAPNAILYVNGSAGLTIRSNVINSGVFGSVKGATINMLGDIWRNTPNASFPDEWGVNNSNSFTGVGGAFRFASTNSQQYLTGGYSLPTRSGPFFPNLVVANPRGLFLYQDDAQISGTLLFENGILSLNDNNLLIGRNNPGAIDGYTENTFIATGNNPKGGFLYRAKVSGASGNVVFPVGTQAGNYAPISIMFNTTLPQDLHVRVFDNIYRNAFGGSTGSPASIQQTWNLGQQDTTKVPSIIAAQHMGPKEGAAFTSHRGNSFISQYDFTAKTWDTVGPSAVVTPGTITLGAPQASTFINARGFSQLANNAYLTKTADTRTDSITLAKAALSPIRQPDGSFLVTYMFLVRNMAQLPVQSVQLLDTLDKVFTSPATFAIGSITATGNLSVNKNYDGVTVTDLLLPASTIAARKTDTVLLRLTVMPNKKDAYFYNSATIKGTINGFNGRQYVIDNRSVNGLTPPQPATLPVPTPVILSASKYQIPEGFSPNGDGVNDKFAIGNLGNDQASVWIFNKQGILIYRNANYRNDWDGTSNLGGPLSNQKVEDGTYFYKVVVTEPATGKQETYYGYVSIWK